MAFIPVLNAFSQDILIKKTGDELEVKVLKISSEEIEYKKWSNPDGPSYIVSKGEVFMIKYKNGNKDIFNDTPSQLSAESSSTEVINEPIKAAPTADNASLIERYNEIENGLFEAMKTKRKGKEKKAYSWYGTLGVTMSSILSSEDIQVTFVTDKKSLIDHPYDYDGRVVTGWYSDENIYFQKKFYIEILNKTSKNIYIDKANTFRIEPDGSYYVYYNSQQTTVNQGSGTGAGLNLGAVTGALGISGVANTLASGVNVGKGKESSVSTVYTDQRIIVIPPHGKAVLSEDTPIGIKEDGWAVGKYKIIAFSEDFRNTDMPVLKSGEYRIYSEQDTPATKRYILNYSYDPEFKSDKQLEFALYIKEAIGTRRNLFGNYNKFIEDISGQKDFNTKSIILYGNWDK